MSRSREALRTLASLVLLTVLLDSLALAGPPWVLLPLLPAGGLLVYWVGQLAGRQ